MKEAEPVREHGRVRRVLEKGYGFIEPDDDPEGVNARGIFFHAMDLLSGSFDEMAAGVGVSFIRIREKEGLHATQVIEDGKDAVPAEERRRGRRTK